MPGRSSYRFLTAFVLSALLASTAVSQKRTLDTFKDITDWHGVVSEGAALRLGSSRQGNACSLILDFDLTCSHGYVVAEKELSLDLPADYRFTFDMRGEASPNNFEFKLTDAAGNVHWLKRLNVEYTHGWTKQRIRKRQISFAWGPAGGGVITTVRKIEFAVSCGSGGKGRIFIRNFAIEPVDTGAARITGAVVSLSGDPGGITPVFGPSDSVLTARGKCRIPPGGWLRVDFGGEREIGGLVIDWDSLNTPVSYDVRTSNDGREWETAYAVRSGAPGRNYVSLNEVQTRLLEIVVLRCGRRSSGGLRRVVFRGAAFSNSPNDFLLARAADAPPGRFPKYFQNWQTRWTVVGVNGGLRKALVNEEGQIEVAKERFSVEPFLSIDGRLVTWSDVKREHSLLEGYLPVPTVTWRSGDGWRLTVQACASGFPDSSVLMVKYTVEAGRDLGRVKLFIAIRPFQVNPPWQALNTVGGAARIDSIRIRGRLAKVNEITLFSLTRPSASGAAEFDAGDITCFFAGGTVPSLQNVHDHFGYASGGMEFDYTLRPGEKGEAYISVPSGRFAAMRLPEMRAEDARRYFDRSLAAAAAYWREKVNRVSFTVPDTALPVINTVRSTLAYIFINRSGSALEPGSRTYDRSWIRDGALTAGVLLRTGSPEEVRDFIDWYGTGQFPSGKIPCVMDARGPDPVPEHDSNGEYIYAVLECFNFTHDTLWLRGKLDAVARAVQYVRSLRAERKTDQFRDGGAEERALYGLVPQSISHEGYSDVPRHSYWDDFFVLRGLKDASTIAGILGEKGLEREFGRERDDFRSDLYASMRQAMKNRNIDYIPGCAELGDFDPTSTSIGVSPCGELGNIPEPQLHNTFERYYRFFRQRAAGGDYVNYTPYETRVIGTFVRLGEKERAGEALEFFMKDRRPASWNSWAEVVWKDPAAPKFIGDMPHTWVGSEFIRSVLEMFAYEREQDSALVLAAGLPDAWLDTGTKTGVRGLRTCYGEVSYSIWKSGGCVVAEVAGDIDPPRHPVLFTVPRHSSARAVAVDGEMRTVSDRVRILRLPATIVITY